MRRRRRRLGGWRLLSRRLESRLPLKRTQLGHLFMPDLPRRLDGLTSCARGVARGSIPGLVRLHGLLLKR